MLPIICFQQRTKDGTESILLPNNKIAQTYYFIKVNKREKCAGKFDSSKNRADSGSSNISFSLIRIDISRFIKLAFLMQTLFLGYS